MPDVSLYVPARNCGSTLGDCLTAIAGLEPSPASVLVVVDEASSDDTLAVAHSHPSKPEVQVQTRSGLSGARNQALQALQTPWVASVDADVMVARSFLGELSRARQALPEAVGIAGRTQERIAGPGDLWRAVMHPHHWGAYPMRGPFMLVSEAIMQRGAVLAMGGYRESLARYGEDSRLSRDLRDAGYALGYWPYARAAHLRHDTPVQALDLRWEYGAPRARVHLEDLAGLRVKFEQNVEFARLAVSRGVAGSLPEVAWMGAVLPLHHALRDARAWLGAHVFGHTHHAAWTANYAHALLAACHAPSSWHSMVHEVMEACVPSSKGCAPPWPAWRGFQQHMTMRMAAWWNEVQPFLASTRFETSAAMPGLGAPEDPMHDEAWLPPVSVTPWTIAPSVHAQAIRESEAWPAELAHDATVVAPPGWPGTHAKVVQHPQDLAPQTAAVWLPRLDAWPAPLATLHEVLARAQEVVVGYRPPVALSLKMPAILTAADLAEACATHGHAIAGFRTHLATSTLHARA